MRFGTGWTLAVMAGAIAAAAPAYAQQAGEAEVDAIIDASGSPEAALVLAHRQADDGDLTGAAATLERILLVDPKSPAVRAYYAALLCRLDDRQRARIELARVGKGVDLSEAQAACGDLGVASESRSSWRGQVAVGLAYDRDAGGALAIRFDIPGLVYPHADGLAFVGSAAVEGRVALGDSGFAYGGIDAQTRNSLSGPDYGYQVGDAKAGLGIRSGMIEASAGGIYRHAWVGSQSFLSEYGGEAKLAVKLAPDTRLTLRGEITAQDYVDLPALSRDGMRYDVALDLSGGGADKASYVVGGGWERKTATTNYLAYNGWRIYGALRVPFGSGIYGAIGGTVRHIDYYNNPTTRDYVEDRYFGRIALGMAVTPRLTLEAAGTATRRDYNAASFLRDYESVGGELRLIFKFGK